VKLFGQRRLLIGLRDVGDLSGEAVTVLIRDKWRAAHLVAMHSHVIWHITDSICSPWIG
jgi:hypothetical protein